MKKNRGFLILLILMSLIGQSCERKLKDIGSFYKWINDPENGMVKSASAGGVKVTLKYLPPEYLVYQQIEEEGMKGSKIDSLLNAQKYSKVFLMTIGPAETGSGDIMYKELDNYKQYKERVLQMNFDMASYLEIHAGTSIYKPMLSTMENTYSTSESRNIYMVFIDDKKQKGDLINAKELELVFQDELFQSGINHFVFNKKEMDHLPEMEFLTGLKNQTIK